jgi:hypothetical protein
MRQADALRKGFNRARGVIWAWLNSDDLYYPGAVTQAVEYLLANPKVGMVYGDSDLIDPAGRILGKFAARQTDYRRMLKDQPVSRSRLPSSKMYGSRRAGRKFSPIMISGCA